MERRTTDRRNITRTATLMAWLLAAAAAMAQPLKERMARRYTEVFDHAKAAAIYEDMDAKGKADAAVLRRLATAYRRLGDPVRAEGAYRRLMNAGGRTPDDLLAFADQLRANGKYQEALDQYALYAQERPDDPRAAGYLERPGIFARLQADSNSATIRTLPINSAQADLGMTVMKDLLVFSSARGEGVGGRHPYNWDGEPYLNLYTALLKGETVTDPLVMRQDVNCRFHDGTVAYDSLAGRLYFTRNHLHYGILSRSGNGNLNLGIFFSDVVSGEFGQPEWGPLVPFEHNDPEVNVGHPFVSPDGRKLFFVSDRAGGFGGTDIWYCDNLGNQWGAPQNLGPKVNTPGNEMHPFLRRDSTLFFASDGHPGLGGLDLFRVKLLRGGPGNVFNLGYPMNTRFHDHGLLLINDSTGFFASDRPGGKGSDDLYGCTIRPPMIHLAGRVIDQKTREPIEGATILLKDPEGKHVKRFQLETGPGGTFRIDVEYHERYLLVANKNGYFQKEMPVETHSDPLEDILVEMVKYDYAAEGLVLHGETGRPLPGAVVALMDANENVIETMTVGDNGRYQFPLLPDTDYRLRAEKPDFFKQSVRISTKGKPSAVIYTDFRLFPLVLDQAVRLENIFYDYNKWDIRPDAAVELDKLVAALLENPTVRIELSSHTDCRGKDAYNMNLSEKRAKSAVEYIISKGVARDRLRSKGYGESKPAAGCKCEQCTEEEHQYNRRTEFKVTAM